MHRNEQSKQKKAVIINLHNAVTANARTDQSFEATAKKTQKNCFVLS